MVIFDGIFAPIPRCILFISTFLGKICWVIISNNFSAQNMFKYSMLRRARARNPGKMVIFQGTIRNHSLLLTDLIKKVGIGVSNIKIQWSELEK
jgi:hypothetical protein